MPVPICGACRLRQDKISQIEDMPFLEGHCCSATRTAVESGSLCSDPKLFLLERRSPLRDMLWRMKEGKA